MVIEKLFSRSSQRALALALALASVVTLTFAARAEALPSKFWGVVPQTTPDADQFQRLERGGVESVRLSFEWRELQPERNGPIGWGNIDGVVEKAVLSGVDVLPTVTGTPAWAVRQARVPGGGGAKAAVHLPVRGAAASAWRNLLRQAILRYGPKGSFWRERPNLPKRPIRFWQIGNEPNFKYFVTKPNAAEYGKLVKISYGIMHRTDRGARIVLAGMFARPKGCTRKRPLSPCIDDFLDQMYRKTPGLRKMFVGVAMHPYSGSWRDLKPVAEDIRGVLKKHRDAGKGIWVTELGWSSQRPRRNNVFAKGPKGQKKHLQNAFRLLKRNQKKWRIKRVYWFSVDDLENSCNFCDGSGLFGAGFTPKPAWYAYVRFAGGKPN